MKIVRLDVRAYAKDGAGKTIILQALREYLKGWMDAQVEIVDIKSHDLNIEEFTAIIVRQ